MRRSGAIVLALLVLGVAGCAPRSSPEAGSSPAGSDSPDLPSGWRWEYFGGVQAGVPGEWRWDNGTQRLHQWCVPDKAPGPAVGRPGVSTLVGCPVGGDPAPGTLVAKTGSLLAFDWTTEPDGKAEAGDQTLVRLDRVQVTVNAPADLRDRIVATIRRVTTDSAGCPTTHPVSERPQQRPAKPLDVTKLRDVTSVSACKYLLARDFLHDPLRLLAALRLDGSAAAEAIREVGRAPIGGGPDSPGDCTAEYSYGDDAIVLRVRSAAGVSEIVLRYSGCDHNGFDDGVHVRALTAAAVAPFIAGPNAVFSFSGAAKRPILRPEPSAS
ncbi:hypothetical protein ACQP00_17260 [Dactylosporangium sp. CS-047395]|uniref:hypothetical protein n=1 Tax=Dactylosporangium sp. CS-047395 TaxID=3239936 RepID=UPI003D8EC23C